MSQPPYASRIDPAWSAYWISRTLTDEPSKGMGSPFSDADAQLFLRACGLAGGYRPDPAEDELLERMWFWLDTHRSG
jgi:hypothetical protein